MGTSKSAAEKGSVLERAGIAAFREPVSVLGRDESLMLGANFPCVAYTANSPEEFFDLTGKVNRRDARAVSRGLGFIHGGGLRPADEVATMFSCDDGTMNVVLATTQANERLVHCT